MGEERRRLEAMSGPQSNYYPPQQYENLPPQGSPKTMPDPRYTQQAGPQYMPSPPERGSSYNAGRNPAEQFNGGYRVNNPSSPFRSSQENIPKKSVSFNPQVNSETLSPVTPPHQQPSSYQPFQRAYIGPSDTSRSNFSPSYNPPVNNVPVPSPTANNNNNIVYRTSEGGGTPAVIGSQEVYRDPRTRIEAKMANKNKQNADRLSFRDKMKFFALEAGENTPKEKPKASTSQRRIESELLHNGQ